MDKYFNKEKNEINKMNINTILNMNITNITNAGGPLTSNSSLHNGYNCNKNFFDNSVLNKINQETTMISNNNMTYNHLNDFQDGDKDEKKILIEKSEEIFIKDKQIIYNSKFFLFICLVNF